MGNWGEEGKENRETISPAGSKFGRGEKQGKKNELVGASRGDQETPMWGASVHGRFSAGEGLDDVFGGRRGESWRLEISRWR